MMHLGNSFYILDTRAWSEVWFANFFSQSIACLFILFSSVQSLSRVRPFATPWIAAHQASLSITHSWSSPKPMSVESVMPFNHLILCCPLLLLPPVFPSIGVFSNESVLPISWPKYWTFNFSISPSNEYSGLICFRIDSWEHGPCCRPSYQLLSPDSGGPHPLLGESSSQRSLTNLCWIEVSK